LRLQPQFIRSFYERFFERFPGYRKLFPREEVLLPLMREGVRA